MISFNSFLVEIYSILVDIVFVASTVLFCIVVFCIVKKSSTMGIYKYYMLYTVIASYAFDITCWVWKPIPLFPTPAIASGHLFRGFGSSAGFTLFTIFIVNMAHYTLSLSMAVLFRYIQPLGHGLDMENLCYGIRSTRLGKVFPGRIQDLINKSRLTPIGFLLYHVTFYIIFVSPSLFLRLDTNEVASEIFPDINYDEAKAIINNYSIMYFSNKTVNITIFGYWFDFFGFPFGQVFLFGWLANYGYACGFTSLLHIAYIWKFRRTMKNTTIKGSKRLHIMFFKAINAQVGLGGLFFILPALTIFALIFLSYNTSSTNNTTSGSLLNYESTLATFCFIAMSSHAFFEYLCICYFITPYRKFICEIVKSCYVKIVGKQRSERLETIKTENTIRSGSLTLVNVSKFNYQLAKRRATISVVNANGEVI